MLVRIHLALIDDAATVGASDLRSSLQSQTVRNYATENTRALIHRASVHAGALLLLSVSVYSRLPCMQLSNAFAALLVDF